MSKTPKIKNRYSNKIKAASSYRSDGSDSESEDRYSEFTDRKSKTFKQLKKDWEKNDTEPIGGLYISSLHPPTSISQCFLAQFLDGVQPYFVISKSNILEIYSASEDGLQLVCSQNFVSPIAAMFVIPRYGKMQGDWVFFVSQRLHYYIVQYSGTIDILSTGSLASRLGRPSEMGISAVYDEESHIVAVHFYEGLIQAIAIPDSLSRKHPLYAVPVRIDERVCLSFAFVKAGHQPCLAVLYEDGQQIRHLKSYYIDITKKQALAGPLTLPFTETGANLIIPLHECVGGLLILGESTISRLQAVGNAPPTTLDIHKPTSFKAFSAIPPQDSNTHGIAVLLSDYLGKLYLLKVQESSLELAELGETVSATCICWLNNSFVFVGSHYGDSQLIRIVPSSGGSCIEEVLSFPNIAPILDFVCIEDPAYGQTQLITCSNAFKDGSLRVVQNELGVEELSSGDIANVENAWQFVYRGTLGIALSFHGETQCLQATSDERLVEWENCPLVDRRQPTVLVYQVSKTTVMQITRRSAQLYDALDSPVKWEAPGKVRILAASAFGYNVVVSLSNKTMVHLRYEMSGRWVIVHKFDIELEVSCLHLSGSHRTLLLIVGCWSESAFRLYRCESSLPWTMVVKEAIHRGSNDVSLRSVMRAEFVDTSFIFIGLGDGRLLVYTGEPPFRLVRSLNAGSQPVQLFELALPAGNRVLAASDRSLVLSLRHGVLHSHPVDVYNCCSARALFGSVEPPFPLKEWHDGLCMLLTPTRLVLGTINETQNINVRSVALAENEFARRLCYQPESALLLVGTVSLSKAGSESGKEQSFVKSYHRDRLESGEAADSYALEELETVEAVLSLDESTGSTAVSVFVVGTSLYENSGRDGEATGRLLLFTATEEGQLHACLGRHLPGPVYALASADGRLVVSTGSEIHVYDVKWTQESDETLFCQIVLVATYANQVLCVSLACTPTGLIAVGDMVRSVTMLELVEADGKVDLRVVGTDANSNWITAVEWLNSSCVIGAEHLGNLFALSATSSDASVPLDTVSVYHLGGQINKFRRGTLSLASSSVLGGSVVASPRLIFATMYGMIGSVAVLSPQRFFYVFVIYIGLCEFLEHETSFKHLLMRQFANERRTEELRGVVDGDLLESLLTWPQGRFGEFVQFLNDNCQSLIAKVPNMHLDSQGLVVAGDTPSQSAKSKGKSTVNSKSTFVSSISGKVLKFNLYDTFTVSNLSMLLQELSYIR